jgi:hypothetical protein
MPDGINFQAKPRRLIGTSVEPWPSHRRLEFAAHLQSTFRSNDEARSSSRSPSIPSSLPMRLPIGKRPSVKLVRKLSPLARLGANANRLSPSRHFRRSAMERVAGFLLAFSRRNKRNGQDPATFELPMTRTDIGDFLALTIETVSRTFTKLKFMHLIELAHSNHVKLIDIDALAELADGNE